MIRSIRTSKWLAVLIAVWGTGASAAPVSAPDPASASAPDPKPKPTKPVAEKPAAAQASAREHEPARKPSSERSAECARVLVEHLEKAAKIPPPKERPYYLSARDPVYAKKMGWPVKGPGFLPGSILPCKRIVAFYGNPNSGRMGILGEYSPNEMLRRFREQVAAWNTADPGHPVEPAIQLIAVVGQGYPGADGMYRKRMEPAMIEQAYGWAKAMGGILILDVQPGRSKLMDELEYIKPYLERPDVSLAIDPEFAVRDPQVPGVEVGTMSAAEINEASAFLKRLVLEHDLPPKVLIVHRYKAEMVTDAAKITLQPEVQIVMHMDGWGPPAGKRDTYRNFVVSEPVEYAGVKVFFHNDTREKSWRTLKPRDILKFHPTPLYIQYQ